MKTWMRGIVVGGGVLIAAACGGDDDGGNMAPSTVEPSPGCEAPVLMPGDDMTVMIDHDGMTREFLLHVGASVDVTQPVPLWIDWHGLTSAPIQQQLFSGSSAKADASGFIVAYPKGVGASFNGGSCCSALGNPSHMLDDVGFGRAIVADVAEKGCVNLKRVYSLGMSNGGYMSEYNACQADDLYAAVAPVSAMGFQQTECMPTRPVPMLAFNGTEDGLVPYTGSRSSIDGWKERNGCTGEPTREDFGESYCETWVCTDDVELTSCTVTGMNHCWPGNPLTLPGFCTSGGLTDMVATDMIWDFFERYTLPD